MLDQLRSPARTIGPTSAAPSLHPPYRPDIDGLRAVAVLSVVIYHALPRWLGGGFVGVDIFFVISGYLISTIIFGGLERGDFSFVDFYRRRIKRIFPSLLTVLAAALIFGWFALLSDEFAMLGKATVAGAGFVANFLFRQDSVYFAGTAIMKPLLHLWSLGVEEQFYIVWPLLVWALWKARFNFLSFTLVIAAISFIENVSIVGPDPVGAFFLPQTRFWELMAGSALAYAALRSRGASGAMPAAGRRANLQSVAGLALIGFAVGYTVTDNFPGWWALPPVAGAMLLIGAGPDALVNRLILSSRVMVWFGLISFPLYLWHWPLLSLQRIVGAYAPPPADRLRMVALAIALAWLTYRFIERPIRTSGGGLMTPALLAAGMAAIGVAGAATYALGGFDGHGYRSADRSAFSAYFEDDAPGWHYLVEQKLDEKFRADCNFLLPPDSPWTSRIPRARIDDSCWRRDAAKAHAVFLWGDSHAQMLYYGLKNNLPPDWQVMIVASSGCPPDAGVSEDSPILYCQRSNWFALNAIRQTRPDVVIAARVDSHDRDRMIALADALQTMGAKTVLMPGPVPQWDAPLPKIVLRRLWDETPERTFVGLNRGIVQENEKLVQDFARFPDPRFVDLFKFFCNESGCLTRVDPDRQTGLASFDFGHLTPVASDYLARNLLAKAVVDAADAANPPPLRP